MLDLELDECDAALLIALLGFGMRVYGVTTQNAAKLKALKEQLESEAKKAGVAVEPLPEPTNRTPSTK